MCSFRSRLGLALGDRPPTNRGGNMEPPRDRALREVGIMLSGMVHNLLDMGAPIQRNGVGEAPEPADARARGRGGAARQGGRGGARQDQPRAELRPPLRRESRRPSPGPGEQRRAVRPAEVRPPRGGWRPRRGDSGRSSPSGTRSRSRRCSRSSTTRAEAVAGSLGERPRGAGPRGGAGAEWRRTQRWAPGRGEQAGAGSHGRGSHRDGAHNLRTSLRGRGSRRTEEGRATSRVPQSGGRSPPPAVQGKGASRESRLPHSPARSSAARDLQHRGRSGDAAAGDRVEARPGPAQRSGGVRGPRAKRRYRRSNEARQRRGKRLEERKLQAEVQAGGRREGSAQRVRSSSSSSEGS